VLIAAAVLGASGSLGFAAPEPTREIMQRVRSAVSTLLPLTLSAPGWEDAHKRDEVQAALRTLTSAADGLAQHAGPEPESFGFLSRSLATDARAIALRVKEGRYATASYLTQRLTETCIACHSRLPAASAMTLASGLTQQIDGDLLSPLTRARLQVATRQFHAALATYEAQFESSAEPPAALEPELPSYLIVSLRVLRDPERADRALGLLAKRPELPAALAQNLATWRSAIRESSAALQEAPTLERAQTILARGRALSEFPADRADLAHIVIASSIAFRFLESSRPQGRERAEALYLLGQTESFTRQAFETSDAEHYLEQTIRAAPHSPLAARAYARLEERLVLSYTGSSGENLPPDVAQLLRELRDLSRVLANASGPGSAERPAASSPSETRAPAHPQ
jgi:hypothetical protein